MYTCKARLSPPPLNRERASAVFEQLRPGVSLRTEWGPATLGDL